MNKNGDDLTAEAEARLREYERALENFKCIRQQYMPNGSIPFPSSGQKEDPQQRLAEEFWAAREREIQARQRWDESLRAIGWLVPSEQ